jgi:hypothetical protein
MPFNPIVLYPSYAARAPSLRGVDVQSANAVSRAHPDSKHEGIESKDRLGAIRLRGELREFGKRPRPPHRDDAGELGVGAFLQRFGEDVSVKDSFNLSIRESVSLRRCQDHGRAAGAAPTRLLASRASRDMRQAT